MTEEERAALWREQYAARCQFQNDRLRALAGSADARLALSVNWQPPFLAALEARAGELYPDCVSAIPPFPATNLLGN